MAAGLTRSALRLSILQVGSCLGSTAGNCECDQLARNLPFAPARERRRSFNYPKFPSETANQCPLWSRGSRREVARVCCRGRRASRMSWNSPSVVSNLFRFGSEASFGESRLRRPRTCTTNSAATTQAEISAATITVEPRKGAASARDVYSAATKNWNSKPANCRR